MPPKPALHLVIRASVALAVVASFERSAGAQAPSPPPPPPAMGAAAPAPVAPPPDAGAPPAYAPQPGAPPLQSYPPWAGYPAVQGYPFPTAYPPSQGNTVPPAYGMPPYYLPPGYYTPGVPFGFPPEKLDYVEGQPIPAGYRVAKRTSRGLLVGGLTTFGAPYVVSLLVGGTYLSEGGASSRKLGPLVAPFAGPFIAIGTARSEGAGTFWLIVDGLTQIAGGVLTTAAILSPETVLLRNDVAQGKPRPELLVGPGAGAVRLRF